MDFALQFIFNPQDLTLLESWQSMQVNDLLESIKIMQQDKQ